MRIKQDNTLKALGIMPGIRTNSGYLAMGMFLNKVTTREST